MYKNTVLDSCIQKIVDSVCLLTELLNKRAQEDAQIEEIKRLYEETRDGRKDNK